MIEIIERAANPYGVDVLPAVHGYLLSWAHWMRGQGVRLSYPARSAGMESGGIVSSFSDDESEQDADAALVVDRIIEDLQIGQKAIIHHVYLAAVYRMRDPAAMLGQAYAGVTKGLRTQGWISS